MESQEIRSGVLKLMEEKDKIEQEIKELTDVLSHNGVGMHEPLVDSEGYPLNTVDVYQVRQARHRIICLQNDHRNIMKQIEGGLQGYYSASAGEPRSTPPDSGDVEMHQDSNRLNYDLDHSNFTIPFAKVSIVTPGSPAELARLHVNDLVVAFGLTNASNYKGINDIADIVQKSEGRTLNVKVKRGDQFISTKLVPKPWEGRGLLGCKIDSLPKTH